VLGDVTLKFFYELLSLRLPQLLQLCYQVYSLLPHVVVIFVTTCGHLQFSGSPFLLIPVL
jgi:hypothetical protein